MTGAAGHYRHVDGLRALAALYVVCHHAYLTVWPVDLNVRATGWDAHLWNWALFGHLAVSVFIVISGYVLTLPFRDRDRRVGALNFFRRRARRILPAYYGSIAFSLLLVWLYIDQPTGTHWDISLPVTRKGVLEHVLLVHHFTGSAEINHVYWSIGVEWWIYLLFPALILLWRRAGIVPLVVLCLAVAYAVRYVLLAKQWPDWSPQYIGLFAFGMGAASIRASKALPWIVAFWVSAAAVVVSCGVLGEDAFRYYHLIDPVAAASVACLLVGTEGGGRLQRALAWKPLATVGVFSYSIYLVHAPLLQVMWQFLPWAEERSSTGLVWLLGGSLPVILAVGYGSFVLLERPFMSARQRESVARMAAP